MVISSRRSKLSENTEKITNPGNKTIYRIYDKKNREIKADLICFADETYDTSEDFCSLIGATWKKTRLEGGSYTKGFLYLFSAKENASTTLRLLWRLLRIAGKKETLWDEQNVFSIHIRYMWTSHQAL